MALEPKRLSKIIFGPVSIYDEGRGDRIFQPVAHGRADGDQLDENSHVLITGFVADLLRNAVIAGDAGDAALLREIAQYTAGVRSEISEQCRRGLLILNLTGYADEQGHFTGEAAKALKFAIEDTGIGELPQYRQIINSAPAP